MDMRLRPDGVDQDRNTVSAEGSTATTGRVSRGGSGDRAEGGWQQGRWKNDVTWEDSTAQRAMTKAMADNVRVSIPRVFLRPDMTSETALRGDHLLACLAIKRPIL